jgi:hypothetical protein
MGGTSKGGWELRTGRLSSHIARSSPHAIMPPVREMTGARLSRHLPLPPERHTVVTKSPLWSSTLVARGRPAVIIIFSWNDPEKTRDGTYNDRALMLLSSPSRRLLLTVLSATGRWFACLLG